MKRPATTPCAECANLRRKVAELEARVERLTEMHDGLADRLFGPHPAYAMTCPAVGPGSSPSSSASHA